MCRKVISLYTRAVELVQMGQPAMLLVLRLWMAKVFFSSGILKISNWETTILLFTEEHPVPFMSPFWAALSGTFFELACPVLLVLGLCTRFATLPLLAMTAVIQFTYLDSVQHYYWAMLLGILLFAGPGKISADFVLSRLLPGLRGRY